MAAPWQGSSLSLAVVSLDKTCTRVEWHFTTRWHCRHESRCAVTGAGLMGPCDMEVREAFGCPYAPSSSSSNSSGELCSSDMLLASSSAKLPWAGCMLDARPVPPAGCVEILGLWLGYRGSLEIWVAV